MEPTLIAIWIAIAALITAYSAVLIRACITFNLKTERPGETFTENNGISVVIPFRNEAEKMKRLALCLKELDTTGLNAELILVNDHSTDLGRQLIEEYLKDCTLEARIIDLSANEKGKKAGIRKGIENSRYDVVATLDADCRPGRLWLESMLETMNKTGAELLTGPVRYTAEKRLNTLAVYQQMENAVLMAITQKQCEQGNAVIGNGANLCFKKQTYWQAERIRTDKLIAGGDDIFLLEAIEKLHPGKIGFAGMKHAIVETDTEKSWGALYEQRVRWAAKVRFQTKPGGFVWQTAAFIFSLLYAGFVLVCAARMYWLLFFSVQGLKLMADVMIVSRPAKELNYKLPFILQLIASIIQPFIVVAVGCKARYGKFNWKDRLLKA